MEQKGLHVAVVGATGAVGQQMIQTLEKEISQLQNYLYFHRSVQLEKSRI